MGLQQAKTLSENLVQTVSNPPLGTHMDTIITSLSNVLKWSILISIVLQKKRDTIVAINLNLPVEQQSVLFVHFQ